MELLIRLYNCFVDTDYEQIKAYIKQPLLLFHNNGCSLRGISNSCQQADLKRWDEFNTSNIAKHGEEVINRSLKSHSEPFVHRYLIESF